MFVMEEEKKSFEIVFPDGVDNERYMVRNFENDDSQVTFTADCPEYDNSKFVCGEMKAGEY